MPPHFKARSSYTEDFQTTQAGPKERRADTADEMKAADTTRDLHQGTTRATHQLPGMHAAAFCHHKNKKRSHVSVWVEICEGIVRAHHGNRASS